MKKITALLLLLPTLLFANKNIKSDLNPTKIMSHSLWTILLKKHVSPEGIVNYSGFKKDEIQLNEYLEVLTKNIPSAGWSENASICYWINCYNAYAIKLIVDHYGVKSINNIQDPWNSSGFTSQGKKYSLDYIEQSFLRRYNEPRIHFAICCASASCSKLLNKAYEEDVLDQQLEEVTKDFINDKSKNLLTPGAVKISKKFEWYSIDFKQNGTIIDFLNHYSDVKINTKAKVFYNEFDWSLNN